jgi:hypothetical protein
VAAELARQRDALLSARPALASQPVQPSRELQEQLRSLGYIE